MLILLLKLPTGLSLTSSTDAPPSGCPMHQVSASGNDQLKKAPDVPAHQDRAYEFVECPMRAANGAKPSMSDINPANMVCLPFEFDKRMINL